MPTSIPHTLEPLKALVVMILTCVLFNFAMGSVHSPW